MSCGIRRVQKGFGVEGNPGVKRVVEGNPYVERVVQGNPGVKCELWRGTPV